MPRIKFTADLTTGFTEMDEQHREIFDLYNAVRDAKSGDDAILTVVFLDNYVVQHCAAEEYVMKEASYPRLAEHAEWHHRFRDDVQVLAQRIKKEGARKFLILRLQFSVETCFVQHVRTMDTDLARFVKELRDAESSDARLKTFQGYENIRGLRSSGQT